jgi:hypothetical protein
MTADTFRRFALGAIACAALLVGSQAASADGPAVADLNGKIDTGAGALDGFGYYFGNGSISLPLGQNIGFQADGEVASVSGNFVDSFGAHLFWRDPDVGLLGGYASYTDFNLATNVGVGRAAAEGEAYLGPWTLTALVGDQFGSTGIVSRVFANANVGYYLTDDVKIYAGYRLANALSVGAAGFENEFYEGNGFAVSFYGEGRYGQNNNAGGWGGLRIYFGSSSTLVQRQRTEDPQDDGPDDVFGGGTGVFNPPPCTTCCAGAFGTSSPSGIHGGEGCCRDAAGAAGAHEASTCCRASLPAGTRTSENTCEP